MSLVINNRNAHFTMKHHYEEFAPRMAEGRDRGSSRSLGISLAFLKFVLRCEFTSFLAFLRTQRKLKLLFNIIAYKREKEGRK